MTAYQRLTATFSRIATLNEAAAVLNWDAAAMMRRAVPPPAASKWPSSPASRTSF